MVGSARRGRDLAACGEREQPMPISARDESRRRVSSRGSPRRLIPEWSRAGAGLRRKQERVKAWSGRSGCRELELAQGVEGPLADLAGDGQPRHRRVAPRGAGGPVEGEVGSALPERVHGGFDERPAQMRRAGLGQLAAAASLAGFVDDRVEAGRAGDLLGAAEATGLADLGQQVAGEDRADPVDRMQRLAALVLAGETAQLGVDRVGAARLTGGPTLFRSTSRSPISQHLPRGTLC